MKKAMCLAVLILLGCHGGGADDVAAPVGAQTPAPGATETPAPGGTGGTPVPTDGAATKNLVDAFKATGPITDEQAAAITAAAGVCAATLSKDLSLQIPKLTIGGSAYSATLKINQAADGSYTTKLTSFEPTTRSDCSDSATGIIVIANNTYLLHVPSLIAGDKQYWVNLEYLPAPGETISINYAGTALAGASAETGQSMSGNSVAKSFAGAGSGFKMTRYSDAVKGVTGTGSAFMSLTQVTSRGVSSTEYQVEERFPGDAQVTLRYRVLENQTYTPTVGEAALATRIGVNVYGTKLTLSATGDSFSLDYFVPSGALSPTSAKSLAQIPTDTQATPQPTSKAQQTAVTLADGAPTSGVRVVVEGTLKEGGKSIVTALYDAGFSTLSPGLDIPGPLGKDLPATGSAILDVVAAFDIKAEHENWMKRLAAAKDCANNPTVPYAAGEEARVKATVATAQTNLKMNTAVRFLNQLGSTATGIAALVPGLNYAVAAISSHTDDALKTLSEADVQVAENGVSCKKAYQAGGGTNDTLTFSGVICDLAKPYTLKAIELEMYFSLIPQDSAGRLGTYTSTATKGSCTSSGHGDYKIANLKGDTLSVVLSGSITITCGKVSVPSVEAYDLTLTPTIAACGP